MGLVQGVCGLLPESPGARLSPVVPGATEEGLESCKDSESSYEYGVGSGRRDGSLGGDDY